MTDSERLKRIEMRQEAMIQAIGGLTEVLEATRDTVLEIQAWAQEPPSDALPKLLDEMVAAFEGLQKVVMAQDARIEALPARIVAALPDR